MEERNQRVTGCNTVMHHHIRAPLSLKKEVARDRIHLHKKCKKEDFVSIG